MAAVNELIAQPANLPNSEIPKAHLAVHVLSAAMAVAGVMMLIIAFFMDGGRPNPFNNGNFTLSGVFVSIAIPLYLVKLFLSAYKIKDIVPKLGVSDDIKVDSPLISLMRHSLSSVNLILAGMIYGIIDTQNELAYERRPEQEYIDISQAFLALAIVDKLFQVLLDFPQLSNVLRPSRKTSVPLPQGLDRTKVMVGTLVLLVVSLGGLGYNMGDVGHLKDLDINKDETRGYGDYETSPNVAAVLIGLHVLLALIGVLGSGMENGIGCCKQTEVISLNEIPLIRIVVVSATLSLLSIASGHMVNLNIENSILVLSLISYLMADMLGRNVV